MEVEDKIIKAYFETNPFQKIEMSNHIAVYERVLVKLNRIAYNYIAPNGYVVWDRYKQLWNNPIWDLGLSIKMELDIAKTILSGEKVDWEFWNKNPSFHHESPYRNHWFTLFTSGKFILNHKKGKMDEDRL